MDQYHARLVLRDPHALPARPPVPLPPAAPLGSPGSWTSSTSPPRALYDPPLDRTATASVASEKSFYAPDKIWDQIVDELKVHDTRDPGLAIANTRALAALCRVNHQLERIVRPALWTDIHIRVHDFGRLVRLLDSTVESPALAGLIHSIHLYVGTPLVDDLVDDDVIDRLYTFCDSLRITEELREKLQRVCMLNLLRFPDSVDAVITLLAASALSLKTLMFAPATEEYRVPSELEIGGRIPPTTLLADFIHQSAVLPLLGPSSHERPLPLRHLKRVQIINDVLELSSPECPSRTASTLIKFCVSPELKEFCGVGWDIPGATPGGSLLQLVQDQHETLVLHLLQQPRYQVVACHGLQVLTLTDCSTADFALAYLLRLFPRLITLDITARPKGTFDWSFSEFGRQLRGTAGKNLRSLRLRGWEPVTTHPPYLLDPRDTILGHLNMLDSLAGLELPLSALVGFRGDRLPETQPLDYLVDSLPTSLRVLSLYKRDPPSYTDNISDRRVEALMAAQDKFRHLCLIRLTNYCMKGSPWTTDVVPHGWRMHTEDYEDTKPFSTVHVGFSRDLPPSL